MTELYSSYDSTHISRGLLRLVLIMIASAASCLAQPVVDLSQDSMKSLARELTFMQVQLHIRQFEIQRLFGETYPGAYRDVLSFWSKSVEQQCVSCYPMAVPDLFTEQLSLFRCKCSWNVHAGNYYIAIARDGRVFPLVSFDSVMFPDLARYLLRKNPTEEVMLAITRLYMTAGTGYGDLIEAGDVDSLSSRFPGITPPRVMRLDDSTFHSVFYSIRTSVFQSSDTEQELYLNSLVVSTGGTYSESITPLLKWEVPRRKR